jgi:hypothetical protein
MMRYEILDNLLSQSTDRPVSIPRLSIPKSSPPETTHCERTTEVNEPSVVSDVPDATLSHRLAQGRPLAVGAGLAVLTMLVAELLPPAWAFDLHALVLVFVAAPYAGFASLHGGWRTMAVEFVGIAGFCLLAVVGLWVWPPAWVVGYAGHAAWDTLHHETGGFGARVVGWYVPFCVVYDLLIAGYLTVVLAG